MTVGDTDRDRDGKGGVSGDSREDSTGDASGYIVLGSGAAVIGCIRVWRLEAAVALYTGVTHERGANGRR